MFGREREQPGLLIEASKQHSFDPSDEAALVDFRTRIWCVFHTAENPAGIDVSARRPWVEAANSNAPAFARVFKKMVLVTNPTQPLPRAGKGTVIRKQALLAYSAEIDKL